jgi:hypothetical protein
MVTRPAAMGPAKNLGMKNGLAKNSAIPNATNCGGVGAAAKERGDKTEKENEWRWKCLPARKHNN